jgi:urease accessory protein
LLVRVFAEERRAPAAAQRRDGRLSFRRVGDRTVIDAALARSPLRLLTPRNHGRAAWAYTSTLGGGLVDGDEIQLHVQVGREACALLASQGHNRVYRSVTGSATELIADVEQGAFLAIVPDPTVCFAHARYRQRTELRLAAGGNAVLVDALTAGRGARGERWAFRSYSGELVLRIDDRVVLQERTLLDQQHGAVAERMGRFDVLCTILLAGGLLRPARARLANALTGAPLRPRADAVEQANDLGDALVIRMAAISLEAALRTVHDRLDFLPELLGDDPWARRP